MPPSNMPVPTESTPMVASVRAPSLAQSTCDISSGIRNPLAASQIQPSTSVSQDRYSNGPPCGDFCCSVTRKSYIVVGRSGTMCAHPMACSINRTSAIGSRYFGKLYPRSHIEQVAHRRAHVAGVRQRARNESVPRRGSRCRC